MEIKKELRYSKTHEWAAYDEAEEVVLVGITDYAQDKIGDITYIELPEEGDDVEKGTSFAQVEHHKGVEEVYSPISGRVLEANEALKDSPEMVNQDCYEDGWLIRVEPSDLAELEDLMTAEEYEEYLSELEEEEL